MGCIEKMKTSNISATMPLIFFILSPCVWENNRLLNKIYWDNLYIIEQGHSNGNISQFCIYLDYPWTNFKKNLTTIMASQPAAKERTII